MRMRRRYPYRIVTVVFLGLMGLVVTAQETPPPASQALQVDAQKSADDKPAQAVPPEVLQKAKTYKGAPTPPRDLQKTDDHWSPYQAPETGPEGAEAYIIQRGDTLSGIARSQLGDMYLWPQIWDLNPYIKDAHWIYPGDPLFIKRPQVVPETVPVAETVPKGEEDMDFEKESPHPPVNAYDVYCSGFITKKWKRPHLAILSAPERERESLSKGYIVYLNEGKAQGMEPGMTFCVMEEGQRITHPINSKDLGRFIRRKGQVKVLAVQEHTSIGEITQSCDEIRYGDALLPWRVIPIPWDIKRSQGIPLQVEGTDRPTGRVIWTEDRLGSVAQFNVVYVDLGSREKVLPGDKVWFFRYPATEGNLLISVRDLYRQSRIDVGPRDLYRPAKVGELSQEEAEVSPEETGEDIVPVGETVEHTEVAEAVPQDPDKAVNQIRQYLAEGVVITTEAETSCVKILNADQEAYISAWAMVE